MRHKLQIQECNTDGNLIPANTAQRPGRHPAHVKALRKPHKTCTSPPSTTPTPPNPPTASTDAAHNSLQPPKNVPQSSIDTKAPHPAPRHTTAHPRHQTKPPPPPQTPYAMQAAAQQNAWKHQTSTHTTPGPALARPPNDAAPYPSPTPWPDKEHETPIPAWLARRLRCVFDSAPPRPSHLEGVHQSCGCSLPHDTTCQGGLPSKPTGNLALTVFDANGIRSTPMRCIQDASDGIP